MIFCLVFNPPLSGPTTKKPVFFFLFASSLLLMNKTKGIAYSLLYMLCINTYHKQDIPLPQDDISSAHSLIPVSRVLPCLDGWNI